jgi:hypothetical protein
MHASGTNGESAVERGEQVFFHYPRDMKSVELIVPDS